MTAPRFGAFFGVVSLGVMSLGVMSLAGCKKSTPDESAPAPSASSSAVVKAAASASGVPADKAAPATGSSKLAGTYEGKYTTASGTLYIPSEKDWSSVKQAKDDPSKHVGEGTLTLTVDPTGRVAGTIDSGPAAPAIVDGVATDSELRGTVRRKDPKDEGLTGVLVARVQGDGAEGKLDLSDANAALLREGKLSLKRK